MDSIDNKSKSRDRSAVDAAILKHQLEDRDETIAMLHVTLAEYNKIISRLKREVTRLNRELISAKEEEM